MKTLNYEDFVKELMEHWIEEESDICNDEVFHELALHYKMIYFDPEYNLFLRSPELTKTKSLSEGKV